MNGAANCWSCGRVIDEKDNYCRYCGKGQGSHVSYYYKSWGIILLFFFIGPLNLYFLWRSPVISKTAKRIYAAVIIAVTYFALKSVFELFNTLSSYYTGNLS